MKKVDITGGPILKSVISFAFPIILGSFVQVAFNAADLMVVGNMGDTAAVAAVGAVSPVVGLLVSSFVGLSAGVNAVLSRCIGNGNEARIKRIVNTAVIFSLLLGVGIMGMCLLFSEPLLSVMGCDGEYFDQAVLYMQVYSIGIPAMMVYNFAAAIIRTNGDTQRPFIYLVIAGIVNVFLNFILCLFIEQKAAAVAAATAASQLVGAILCFVHLLKLNGSCGLNLKELSFSFRELFAMLKIGVPCAFNSALFSLSNLQMHAAINAYGTNATAGNAAAANIESLVSSITGGFVGATVPFVGQNIGSGNQKRVKQSMMACLIVSTVISFIVSISVYAFGEPILSLYLPDSPDAIVFGMSRMKFVLLFMAVASMINVLASGLQAFGYSFIPMMNSILAVFVFRIAWLEFVYPRLDAIKHTIDNVYMCYTFSWLLLLLAHFTMFMIIYARYKKGKVAQI